MGKRRTHAPNWLSLRVTTGGPGVQRGTQEVKCGSVTGHLPN